MMNTFPIPPDDPRLTAYALGELEGDERAAVDAAVRADPALRGVVTEIRATAAQLESALAAEPFAETAPALLPAMLLTDAAEVNGHALVNARESVGPAAGRVASTATGPAPYGAARSRGKVIQFPQFYYIVGGLAAACFAVIVALNRDDYAARERSRVAALRVAMERRAAETRLQTQVREYAASGPTTVSLPPFTPPASESGEVASGRERAAANTTPAISAPTANRAPEAATVAFAPSRLSLLEQVQVSAGATLPDVPVAGRAVARDASRAVSAKASPGGAPFSFGISNEIPSRTAQTKFEPKSPAMAVHSGKAAPNALSGRQVDPAAETVTLSAFEVTADREISYARSASLVGERVARAAREREMRPRAPAGARFGRGAELDAPVRDNPFVRVALRPLSTFSATVGTASYARMRRMMEQQQLPPRDAVRIEELLNYFPYRYPAPAEEPASSRSLAGKLLGEEPVPPFAAAIEVAEAPWAPSHRLVRIGLKAREVTTNARAAANLVFLVNVSESMQAPHKLPLVKESLQLTLGTLRPDDRVAIVTYAGDSTLALPPTPVARAGEIRAAIDSLRALPGLAPGARSLRRAYETAVASLAAAGAGRVILCTDAEGMEGMGASGLGQRLAAKAAGDVSLTVLGFGVGSFNEGALEQLATQENGHYGSIESRRDAEKLLVNEVNGTLVPVAKDVKIQVEFNPARVASYRLLGYENRLLRRADFNTDDIDAGEVGAGHMVTALYEIVPVSPNDADAAVAIRRPDLKYSMHAAPPLLSSGFAPATTKTAVSQELLTVNVRYKKPDGFVPRTLEFPVTDGGASFANASADFRFAAAVAQFGMILRQSEHKGVATLGDVIAWAAGAAAKSADDPGGYRGEFIDLARQAQELLRTE